MRKNPPIARVVAQTRFRSIVTTMLLIALSFMIVRDILIRRWGSAAPASSDVTERTR